MGKIVVNGASAEIVEKKSRFIANIQPVSSDEEAIEFVNKMKKKYYDARHNCMAYVTEKGMRFSDDGEPQGTAGKPMLDVLCNWNISNAVVVVTRYFGGILLGTGGLVRAYQKATIEGLNNCVIAEKMQGYMTTIITDYNGLGKIQYIAANSGINIRNVEYTDVVKIEIISSEDLYESFVKEISETTAGKAIISEKRKAEYFLLTNGDIEIL